MGDEGVDCLDEEEAFRLRAKKCLLPGWKLKRAEVLYKTVLRYTWLNLKIAFCILGNFSQNGIILLDETVMEQHDWLKHQFIKQPMRKLHLRS